MTHRVKAALLGSALAVGWAVPVWAQSSGSIEEVVVTASKRAEHAKDVPMAISAIGENQLDQLNARSFADYINSVPGMSMTQDSPTHPELILRGINSGGVASTVGTYIDETPFGSSSALANGAITAPNLDTFDMQRVEVLRGPQGTLYGANTMGGLLKFVTNAPDPSGFATSFEAGATTVDNGGAGGFGRVMINLPTSDTTAVRLVGFDSHDGGWIDDPGRGLSNINGVTDVGGRAEFLYQPSADFSLRLTAMTQKIDAADDTAEDIVITGRSFHPLVGDYKQLRTTNTPSSSVYTLYNGTLNWDLKWATVTSATSYGMYDDLVFQDGTGVLGVDIDGTLHTQKFTQEVRLASDAGGPLDWLVGGYYTHETTTLLQNLVFGLHQPSIGFLKLAARYSEKAAFANVTYHLTPQFDIGAGARYGTDDQSSVQSGLASATGASSDDVFTWSVAAHYKLDEQVSLYARVAKGFHPGGPNDIPLGSPPGAIPSSFGPDSLIDYEAGVKGDVFDGTVSFDADVYYITWDNIQLLTIINNTGVNGNGGSARSEGFEWDVYWQPLSNLTLSWNGAYTDAKLTADTSILVGGKDGDPLPWAPKWTNTINADYHFNPGGEWRPYVGASWRFVGERDSDFQAGGRPFLLDSYDQIDARVGMDWQNWELELYGKNLNNSKGVTAFAATGTSAASGNAATVALIPPRLFGVVLRAKF